MLELSPDEMVARARAELRLGAPVALVAGEAGALAVAAETVGAPRLADLHALGPVDMVITARRAETLRARAYDGDIARVAVAPDMALGAVHALANPGLALDWPMQGPYPTRRAGDAAAHRLAIRLVRAARLLPAALIAPMPAGAAQELAARHGLTLLTQELVDQAQDTGVELELVSSARVPLAVAERARVHVFRPASGEEEHYAIEIGAPPRAEPVLSRLHSACFTGDLIGSLKCDCGPQLQAALRQIGEAGAGVLLYLNQEGRGIGLANKLRAYALQDQGFDTVEANHRLGFEDDERDFRIGARILTALGFSAVRLMTNNPGKVKAMEEAGVRVAERTPLIVGKTAHNVAYLATKARKSGHLL